MKTTRRRLAAAVLAVSLLAAACGDDDPDDAASAEPAPTEPTTSDPPASTTTETTQPASTEPAAPPPDDGDQLPDSSLATRAARIFTFAVPEGPIEAAAGERAPTVVEAGTYTTAGLGTELTLTLDGPWRLDEELAGFVSLVRDPATEGPEQRSLLLTRPAGLLPSDAASDPERDRRVASEATQSVGELGAWLESTPAVVVLDEGTEDVGGLTADRYDVTVDPTAGPTLSCGPGEACLSWAFVPTLETALVIREGRTSRIWSIDQGEQPPLIIVASAQDEDFATFAAEVETTVSSLVFGDPAPPPVDAAIAASSLTHVASGAVELGLFGGTLQVDDALWVSQTAGYVIVADGDGPDPGQRPPSGALLRAVRSLDGRVFAEAAEVVDWMLSADGVRAEVIGEEEVFGVTATVVEAISDPAQAFATGSVVYVEAPDEVPPELISLPPPPAMRFWAFDTDTGPMLLVAAGISTDSLEPAIAMAQELAARLTLS